ncbi:hypothetical protein K439DRAFT_1637428 [Ramaria rubella]|nr:hypothetical protein K439DRAFT_1637428 [Ramaria rubella]
MPKLEAHLLFPALFGPTILVDPIIVSMPIRWQDQMTRPSARSSSFDCSALTYSARKDAITGLRKSPFWSAWNPAAVEECAVRSRATWS